MEFFDEKEVKIIASSVIDLILESSSSESELDNDSENEDFGIPVSGFLILNSSLEIHREQIWENIKNYSDTEFWYHFRITRSTFECIANFLASNGFKTENGSDQSLRRMLYMTLKYLGKQGSISVVAQYFSCEISELESAIDQVCNCLHLHQNKVLKLPQGSEPNQVSRQFKENANFPGVVGVIGESHIEIQSSKKIFYNCDNFHSIVCLAVVNPDKSFSYIFTGFPGSYKTSYIFQQSFLYCQLEQDHQICDAGEYHLIGNSNFDLKPWMMVPYEEPLTVSERMFNYSLHRTRKVFDEAFDDLQSRFRRCHFIDDPSKCVKIIVASCVIHNLCVTIGDRCIDYFPSADCCNREISHVSVASRREPSLAAQQKRKNICQLLSAEV